MSKVDQFLASIGFKPKIVSPLPEGASMMDGKPAVKASSPTPTPYPGEDEWVLNQFNKRGGDARELHKTYRKAVESPDFTGKYYGQKEATPTPTPTGMPVEQAVLGTSTDVAPDFDKVLNDYIFPVTREAGIPDALAASQTAIESGRRINPNNNLHGIMQWDAQGKRSLRSFTNPSESAEHYVHTIKKNFPEAYSLRDNPKAMLKALQTGGKYRYEGDKSDPMEYVGMVENTPEWRKYSAVK